MGRIVNKPRWDAAYERFSVLSTAGKDAVNKRFIDKDSVPSLSEEVLEDCIQWFENGCPEPMTADEYEDIMAGEEIWDQLQGSQTTS